MTRHKPVAALPLTITSLEEADAVLAKIAARRRFLAVIENNMNEKIDDIKAEAAVLARPHKTDIAELEAALVHYASVNKPEVFGQRKSLELPFGVIGFRASTKLKLIAKHTWERVLQALADNGLVDCIRIKGEVDKEAMKGLSPEHLKELGCKLVQEDAFFYELNEQALSGEGVV